MRSSPSACGERGACTVSDSTRTGATAGDAPCEGCETGEHATTLAIATSTRARTGYLTRRRIRVCWRQFSEAHVAAWRSRPFPTLRHLLAQPHARSVTA